MVESEFSVNTMRTDIMPCYHCAGWWWWCNGVCDVFLAHFRPLSGNWASFKCHGQPEHCVLNPIEHLWDVVEQGLFALDVHPTNLYQLKEAILSVWANISMGSSEGN